MRIRHAAFATWALLLIAGCGERQSATPQTTVATNQNQWFWDEVAKARQLESNADVVFTVEGTRAIARSDEPNAKSLKKCPSGHTTLKDVPIVYGLPLLEGQGAEKWREGIQKLEFVSGGCSKRYDSPMHEVICTTCRFSHSIFSTQTPDDGSWFRTSPDVSSFPKSISALVKSFPVPPAGQQMESVSFTQSLGDKMDVRYEGIGYRTSRALADVTTDVNDWLKANNIECTFTNYFHTSTLDGAKRDILEWRTQRLSVSIRLHHEHSDGSSSVDLTLFKRP